MVILTDSREQQPWIFDGQETLRTYLPTADYTTELLKEDLVLERKKNASEFYGNICGKDRDRFERELERMRSYKYAFVVLEFQFCDIVRFPWSTDLKPYLKKKIGNKSGWFLKRF